MSPRKDLKTEYVRSILDYNPETGVFIWKERADRNNSWNTQNAWKIAGSYRSDGYLYLGINGKRYYGHRIAWLWMTGEWIDEIDHRDLNPSNNKWENLREATHSQNNSNASIRSDNTSGYKGITLIKSTKKWAAQIFFNKKHIHLGCFNDIQDAVNAYNLAAVQYHGEFARVA